LIVLNHKFILSLCNSPLILVICLFSLIFTSALAQTDPVVLSAEDEAARNFELSRTSLDRAQETCDNPIGDAQIATQGCRELTFLARFGLKDAVSSCTGRLELSEEDCQTISEAQKITEDEVNNKFPPFTLSPGEVDCSFSIGTENLRACEKSNTDIRKGIDSQAAAVATEQQKDENDKDDEDDEKDNLLKGALIGGAVVGAGFLLLGDKSSSDPAAPKGQGAGLGKGGGNSGSQASGVDTSNIASQAESVTQKCYKELGNQNLIHAVGSCQDVPGFKDSITNNPEVAQTYQQLASETASTGCALAVSDNQERLSQLKSSPRKSEGHEQSFLELVAVAVITFDSAQKTNQAIKADGVASAAADAVSTVEAVQKDKISKKLFTTSKQFHDTSIAFLKNNCVVIKNGASLGYEAFNMNCSRILARAKTCNDVIKKSHFKLEAAALHLQCSILWDTEGYKLNNTHKLGISTGSNTYNQEILRLDATYQQLHNAEVDLKKSIEFYNGQPGMEPCMLPEYVDLVRARFKSCHNLNDKKVPLSYNCVSGVNSTRKSK
jgi:hypothetical protein